MNDKKSSVRDKMLVEKLFSPKSISRRGHNMKREIAYCVPAACQTWQTQFFYQYTVPEKGRRKKKNDNGKPENNEETEITNP
jgi:hypothetical protein